MCYLELTRTSSVCRSENHLEISRVCYLEPTRTSLLVAGEEEMEASASLKYNHNKHTVVVDVVAPDYDIEAGIKLALTDSDGKGKKMRGITIDVTNRNIPQLTLVGRTRFLSEFLCFLSKV